MTPFLLLHAKISSSNYTRFISCSLSALQGQNGWASTVGMLDLQIGSWTTRVDRAIAWLFVPLMLWLIQSTCRGFWRCWSHRKLVTKCLVFVGWTLLFRHQVQSHSGRDSRIIDSVDASPQKEEPSVSRLWHYLRMLLFLLFFALYQLDMFLYCWLWILSVSNWHDCCHHYHCQYTIIAGSQASGFNLYIVLVMLFLFSFSCLQLCFCMLALIQFAPC